MTSNPDFSKFGKTFQESLVKLLLEDRPFCDQLEEVLDVSFFELKYLRVFSKIIIKYREKFNTHPNAETLGMLLRTSLDEESPVIQKQVRDFFSRINKTPVDASEYIKTTALDFCKKQKLKEAILQSVNLLESSSYEDIKTVIDEATKLGLDNDYGHDYKKDFEARYEIKARSPVSTGWDHIDKICKDGLGKGELGVVIAPTGAGKSMALVHLGAEALKKGKNVVHYTLELSEAVVGLRYDSCLSGLPLKDLFSLKDNVYETCIEIPGELILKEYPTKTASPRTLRNHLEKLIKKDKKIDLIIVDYGDILRPTNNFREKRNELESIYEELRALAQEYECPLWTASQTNRSGLNAEVITMESISEAFNKCFIADFIFSISRTIENKNNNTARMFVAKNRNGPDGLIYPLFMDTSRVKIKVLEPTDETIEQVDSQSALKKQREKIKNIYKESRRQ
jgi:archaellum biogenesis ATPase FlaH